MFQVLRYITLLLAFASVGSRLSHGAAAQESKDDLLIAVTEKGVRLNEQNFAEALGQMYTSKEGKTAKRLPLLEPSNFSLNPDIAVAMVGRTSTKWFSDWPARSERSDLIELKIILDDKLVPSFKYFTNDFGGTTIRAFVGKPTADLQYVRSELGRPTAETKIKEDTILAYGRIRVVVGRDEKISVVVF